MKQILRLALTLAILLSPCLKGTVLPYLSIRSQGINDARELVGWQKQINKAGICHTYGSFSITPEYTRSFHQNRIAQALFSDALVDNCCGRATLSIEGTQAVNRNAKSLMAENFYLPTDYKSIVSIEPRIDNFLVDFNMYLGLDGWHEGLFFRIHAPVVYTRWDLNYNETIINEGTKGYDPGYFTDTWTNDANPQGLDRSFLHNSFAEYITDGLSLASVNGITFDPLANARWSRSRKTLTGVADVRMQLGYNFLSCPDYHAGLSFYVAAPTGNRPEGQFLFEPIIGNGKHWELGAGFTSHKNLWKSENEYCSWDMYLDANITHLFKTRQCRTFDLKGKPLSRYMLMTKMGTPVQNLLAVEQVNATVAPLTSSGFTAPSVQFQKEFQPLANISTIPVNVSASVQADIVLKLAWTMCNFQWDLGYNFWARSCEKICRYTGPCCYAKFPLKTWALKGDAHVFGFEGTIDLNNPTNPIVGISAEGTPLSATENNATIFGGTNNWPNGIEINSQGYILPTGLEIPWSSNPGIDNPKASVTQQTNPEAHVLSTYSAVDEQWAPVATSLDSVFIKEADLDLASAQQRGISNKLFTHLSYTWADHCGWVPFFGIGGEVEWGRKDHSLNYNDSCKKSDCCDKKTPSCSTSGCHDFALSQWGVWFKGGVSFN